MKIDIKDCGAVGDGQTDNTDTIQETIDRVHEAGGGTVSVPEGRFISGTLKMKSNVILRLEKGAELLGIHDLDRYCTNAYMFHAASEPMEHKGYALIYAEGAENFAIEGEGTIDGRGSWFDGREKRPFLLRFIECKNVKISGVILKNAAAWCTHILRSSYVLIEGIELISKGVRNADGIDIDSCNHVSVKGCSIDSHDDAVCLKTTSNMPCENISVTDCQIRSACSGVKIGTESVGDFRNIAVLGCTIYDCDVVAVKITPVDGGCVENFRISDCVIENSTGPIFVAVGKRMKSYVDPPALEVSSISGLVLENLNITCKPYRRMRGSESLDGMGQGIVLAGRPDSRISNVTFRNVDVAFWGGVEEKNSEAFKTYLEAEYPECHALGMLPTWGWYFGHTENVVRENCTSTCLNQDVRKEYFITDTAV